MVKFSKYVGLDVHKETIAVAVAPAGAGTVRYVGEIAHHREAVRRLLKRLSPRGARLRFCYEAGPCGYELYRQLVAAGQSCIVAAPAMIPRKPGDRVKTDRRDAQSLARLNRSGELSAVWVPGTEQEAMRDLSRARVAMKTVDRQLRQRLSGFLLRHGRVYRGKCTWTQAHWRWIEEQRLEMPNQQIVLEEYAEAVRQAQHRTALLAQQLHEAIEDWSLGTAALALTALRGIDRTAAATLLAELDDISRFDHPRQLMSFVGLVPSESSSGALRRRGRITKAGNTHARRILVECAWAYRFPARKTARLQRRAERASAAVQTISWNAQVRLCGRYRRLQARGLNSAKTMTALARELCGFVWAVVCEVQRPQKFPVSA